MTTRREVIQKLFKSAAVMGSGGLAWGNVVHRDSKNLDTLRPPGALPPNTFQQACIKCGKCVEACPYDTLKLAVLQGKGVGTPYFIPRKTPCYLCTDIPCVHACPSGALNLNLLKNEKDTTDVNTSRMGLAVVHKESCIAFSGIQCDACYRACPLMGKAITLDKEINTFTNHHANLKPVINGDVCTGCGLCEKVCVTGKAAIRVLPLGIATGKVGNHYIESWKDNDEKKIHQIIPGVNTDNSDVNSAIDYLNNDDELYD